MVVILDKFTEDVAEIESKISSGAVSSVAGAEGFSLEGPVFVEKQIEVGNPHFEEGLLPRSGIAVSTEATKVTTSDGDLWEVTLPSVEQYEFPGFSGKARKYSVLFVDAETGASFAYPPLPLASSDLTLPEVVPNSKCPDELHAIWTTTARDVSDPDNYEDGDTSKDMIKHATWHPLIDPVYYCSYGHDHGSYPGKLKPAFTATAWKTEDVSTDNNRQDESQEGFKVFNMQEDGFRFIFTVHMELNNPRRFHTRHHTVHANVFTDDWKMKAELTLKNDFGFAGTKPKNQGVQPLNAAEAAIAKSLKKMRRRAFREFNVRSRSDACHFEGAIDTTPGKNDKGGAEHWQAPLNTCSGNRGGFKVDVQRPATGLKTCDNSVDKLEVDTLTGASIKRAFTSLHRGFHMSRDQCSFSEDLPTEVDEDGLIKFYTDSYFSEVVPGEAKFHIAQWMAPDFSATLPAGRYTAEDHWHGKFVRKGKGGARARGTFNTGGWAVIPEEN